MKDKVNVKRLLLIFILIGQTVFAQQTYSDHWDDACDFIRSSMDYNIFDMTVDFCGVELDVEFDREPVEPENDLWGRVENARAFYNDCEVTDILHALDKYLYLKELIEEKL